MPPPIQSAGTGTPLCIPDGVEHISVDDYPAFLAERRKLMALRMKTYFGGL